MFDRGTVAASTFGGTFYELRSGSTKKRSWHTKDMKWCPGRTGFLRGLKAGSLDSEYQPRTTNRRIRTWIIRMMMATILVLDYLT